MNLSFGSDGFRSAIGAQFTLNSLARITLGLASHLLQEGRAGAVIPLGHDTRFMARQFARFSAQILQRAGFRPQLAAQAVPSPWLSFVTRELAAPLGLQITASHNPSQYCGVKLKGPHGGSLYEREIKQIERAINAVSASELAVAMVACNWPADGEERANDSVLLERYAGAVSTAARRGGGRRRIIVDCMHGTATGVYLPLLRLWHSVAGVLRSDPDPLFGGGRPEPLPQFLAELMSAVKADGAAIGIAFDGDGDRLAVVAEDGRLLGTHEIYALLLEHLAADSGLAAEGKISSGAKAAVISVSFSALVSAAATAHGLSVLEVPIGFKHICQAMRDHKCLIGGEESGGTAFGHYLPERDALLMALLLLEAVSASGGRLSDMLDSLTRRYGPHHYHRRDLNLHPAADRELLRERIEELASLPQVSGDPVLSRSRLDGMKLGTGRGWVLVRASGTEPLLRLYAEAESPELAASYAHEISIKLDLPSLSGAGS